MFATRLESLTLGICTISASLNCATTIRLSTSLEINCHPNVVGNGRVWCTGYGNMSKEKVICQIVTALGLSMTVKEAIQNDCHQD